MNKREYYRKLSNKAYYHYYTTRPIKSTIEKHKWICEAGFLANSILVGHQECAGPMLHTLGFQFQSALPLLYPGLTTRVVGMGIQGQVISFSAGGN